MPREAGTSSLCYLPYTIFPMISMSENTRCICILKHAQKKTFLFQKSTQSINTRKKLGNGKNYSIQEYHLLMSSNMCSFRELNSISAM